ncbi:MAG: helix-turn-helix domain-containing protein [Myxococcota bacterium]
MDALLHPVRLRILLQMAGPEAPLSAKEVAARLTDVPHATLYRHVRALADAEWLVRAEEVRARGAVEVRYRLAEGDAVATADDLVDATLDDHRRWFGLFVGTLLGTFTRYSHGPNADPIVDGVRYRVDPIFMDDDAVPAFHEELQALVSRYRSSTGRARILATFSLPDPDRK